MRSRAIQFAVLLGVAAATVAVGADYPVRTWTNDQGETIDAALKRVSGANAILDHDGEIIRAPIVRLSAADQEWIKTVREMNRWRDWTMADGSTRRAKLESLDDDKLTLKDREESFELTLDSLSDVDRGKLSEVFGIESSAPASDLDVVDDSADHFPTPRSAALPQDWQVASPVMRDWTDINGKTIHAEILGVEDNHLLLFFKDREWRVPMWRFSDADQQFVRDLRMEQYAAGEALLADDAQDAASPARESYDTGMNAIRGRMNPGLNETLANRDVGTSDGSDRQQPYLQDNGNAVGDNDLARDGDPDTVAQQMRPDAPSDATADSSFPFVAAEDGAYEDDNQDEYDEYGDDYWADEEWDEEYDGEEPGGIAIFMMLTGLLAICVGGIWFLGVAFMESPLWGLGCMFVPFVSLVFVSQHSDKAGVPFAINAGGYLLIFLASSL